MPPEALWKVVAIAAIRPRPTRTIPDMYSQWSAVGLNLLTEDRTDCDDFGRCVLATSTWTRPRSLRTTLTAPVKYASRSACVYFPNNACSNFELLARTTAISAKLPQSSTRQERSFKTVIKSTQNIARMVRDACVRRSAYHTIRQGHNRTRCGVDTRNSLHHS